MIIKFLNNFWIFYVKFSFKPWNLIDIKNLTTIDIRITDDKNRVIDFNNCNWYLTFQIDYIYKEVPVKINLQNFLKNESFIKEYLKSLE